MSKEPKYDQSILLNRIAAQQETIVDLQEKMIAMNTRLMQNEAPMHVEPPKVEPPKVEPPKVDHNPISTMIGNLISSPRKAASEPKTPDSPPPAIERVAKDSISKLESDYLTPLLFLTVGLGIGLACGLIAIIFLRI